MVPEWLEQAAPLDETDPLYILMREEEDEIDTTEDTRLGVQEQILTRDALYPTDSDEVYDTASSIDTRKRIDERISRSLRHMIRHKEPFERMLHTLTRMGMSQDEAVDTLLVLDPNFTQGDK